MALHSISLYCADVPLRNCSLTHSASYQFLMVQVSLLTPLLQQHSPQAVCRAWVWWVTPLHQHLNIHHVQKKEEEAFEVNKICFPFIVYVDFESFIKPSHR